MNNPKISILIPLYNDPVGIKNTLNSIKNQIFENFEVILVNDGCTDESVTTAKNVFPKIRIIDQVNSGISIALNNGIHHCRGEFIARIDAGDIANPLWLEKLRKFLDSNPSIGAVGCHINLIDEKGNYLGTCNYELDHVTIVKELLRGNSPLTHSGSLIREELLKKVDCYDPFYNGKEDFELWSKISLISKLANYDEVLINIRTISYGISFNSNHLDHLIKLALLERKFRNDQDFTKINQKSRQKFIANYSHSKLKHYLYFEKRGIFLLRSGYRKGAIIFLINSLKLNPFRLKSLFGLIFALFLPIKFFKFSKKIIQGINEKTDY